MMGQWGHLSDECVSIDFYFKDVEITKRYILYMTACKNWAVSGSPNVNLQKHKYKGCKNYTALFFFFGQYLTIFKMSSYTTARNNSKHDYPFIKWASCQCYLDTVCNSKGVSVVLLRPSGHVVTKRKRARVHNGANRHMPPPTRGPALACRLPASHHGVCKTFSHTDPMLTLCTCEFISPCVEPRGLGGRERSSAGEGWALISLTLILSSDYLFTRCLFPRRCRLTLICRVAAWQHVSGSSLYGAPPWILNTNDEWGPSECRIRSTMWKSLLLVLSPSQEDATTLGILPWHLS